MKGNTPTCLCHHHRRLFFFGVTLWLFSFLLGVLIFSTRKTCGEFWHFPCVFTLKRDRKKEERGDAAVTLWIERRTVRLRISACRCSCGGKAAVVVGADKWPPLSLFCTDLWNMQRSHCWHGGGSESKPFVSFHSSVIFSLQLLFGDEETQMFVAAAEKYWRGWTIFWVHCAGGRWTKTEISAGQRCWFGPRMI